MPEDPFLLQERIMYIRSGAKLKFAENNWNEGGLTNLLPDTNTWVMSNGKPPMYGAVIVLKQHLQVHGRHSPVFLIPICLKR